MNMKKTLVGTAVAAALAIGSSVASAATIVSLDISDIDGDGKSGLFTFGPKADIESIGVQFSGDTGTDMLWEGNTQGPGVFTTGFTFAGQPFEPQTDMSATVGTNNGANGTLTGSTLAISSLDFGGRFGGTAGSPVFYLSPDAGTLQVLTANEGTGEVKFNWSHTITASEDPSFQFVGFTASWQLEGIATLSGGPAPIPVPAAAWLFGSGLMGLVGVARRRKVA